MTWKCYAPTTPRSLCGLELSSIYESTRVGPYEWLTCPIHGIIAGREQPRQHGD